jgi:hypothetical protein
MYKNPEKQKANRLAWEQANPEKRKASREKDKEKARIRAAKRRQANPQKVIDGNKRAYQKRLDKCSKE